MPSSSYSRNGDQSSEETSNSRRWRGSTKRSRNDQKSTQREEPSDAVPWFASTSKGTNLTKSSPQSSDSEEDDESSSDSSHELKLPPPRRIGKRRMLRAMLHPKPFQAAAAVASKKDSDSEWEESDEEDSKNRRPNKRIPATKKPKSTASTTTATTTSKKQSVNNSQNGTERWSELIVSKHILAEEVQAYLLQQQNQTSITETDKEHLQQWVSRVHTELDQQNQIVLENIHLVTTLRKVSRRCNQLQDQLLLQKKAIQATQQETQATQGQVQATQQQESKCTSANRFLWSLRKLAAPRDG